MPNSFDNFVDMKYNDGKKYTKLKRLYKDTKEYNYTIDLFKNHGVPDKYIPQTVNEFIDIKLNKKLEYEGIKFRKKLIQHDNFILKKQKQLLHKIELGKNGELVLKQGKSGVLGSEILTKNEYYDEIRKRFSYVRGTGLISFKINPTTGEKDYREYILNKEDFGLLWHNDHKKRINTKSYEIRYDKDFKYHITPVNERE